MREKIDALIAALGTPPQWTPGQTATVIFLIGWWPILADEWIQELLSSRQETVRAWMLQVTGRDQSWERPGQLRGELGVAAYEAAAKIGEPTKGQAYVDYSSRFAVRALKSLAAMLD